MEKEVYKCEKCKTLFKYRSTWYGHKTRCIEGLKRTNRIRKYECRFCPDRFITRNHAEQHERIHTGEKPWKCNNCEECFQYRNRWKNHVRICTGIEPASNTKHGQHKCTQCDQVFKKISRLEKHTEARHLKLKESKSEKRLIQYEKRRKQKMIEIVKETEERKENEGIPQYGTAEEMNEDKDNMERIENNQQTGDEDKTDKQGEQRMKELFHGIRGSLKEIRLTPRTQLKVILSQGKRTLECR